MASTTVERELLERERRYWRTIKDKDVDAALKLTNDPCLIAGASGVATIDRQTFVKIMEGAQYTLHDFTIEDDAQVHQLTDDVAVMAYKVSEDLTVDGQRLTLNASDTSVWLRRDGSWVCAMHTESVLGDAYGRDRKPMTG